MSHIEIGLSQFPPDQEAIKAKCFHPSGSFIEFKNEEIEQSIPERFEKIVHQNPCRVAIQSDDHRLTYEQLNGLANRIAHTLLGRCDKKEERIALVLESDAPMIAAFLGGLKAGKIYVPLDPALPRARIDYILDDAQATLVITNTRYLSLARELTKNRLALLDLDDLDPALSTENPDLRISPDTLTWILYTSGSTGRPKGVVQNHRNVLHFVKNYTNGLHICADDRLTLLFSGSANGAAHDTFSALLNGASLHPLRVKEKGPAAVANWLIQNYVTIYCSVPTVFRHFLETLTGEESFPDLRLIKLIGEPVSKRDVELYQRHFSPDCVFINRLGSTETGTIRWYFINKETQIEGNIVPVGYPADDNEILLLDDKGQEVGAEAVGEIAVKSHYLTPGYWQKPDLTSAVLFSTAGGERIYRSGDIGRLLPDGRLLCLGRKDSQVKIRGYRVEIGEIEMALMNLGLIKAAVVIAWEDRPDNLHLVAYMTAKELPPPTVTKLRRALAETLPEHMIPTRFIFLDAFPSAPNGKIDRKALPDPNKCRPALDTPYVAARTSIERKMGHIWADVLGLDQVGVYDNFFDLGGHSLLATQVISRVDEAFQVELPLPSFFESPTVAGLAERIENIHADQKHKTQTLPMVSVSREKDLPLSFSQQRLWFLDQYEPNSSVYNIPSALRLRGSLNIGALEQSLNETIRRHESLRTTFSTVDGEPVQVIAPSVEFSLPVVDLRDRPEDEREKDARQLARKEASRPFDLARGPLFRSKLVRLGENDHVLLLTMHHIVSDGWSMGVFQHELWTLYQSFSNGHSSPLPELPIQYADFAHWQRTFLQGDVLENQLAYWKRQLAGRLPVVELPTDRPRPPVQSFRGAEQSTILSDRLSNALRTLAGQEGVTLFMVLLAAFNTLLHRYTGQSDIIVGIDIANRSRKEIEGLIGFFVNLLVIRLDLSGNPKFQEFLKRVRNTTLEAYAHQDVPFEKLVEELKPDRDMSRNPLVQTLFVMQNFPRQQSAPEDLDVTPFHMDTEISRFDLALFVENVENRVVATFKYKTDLFEAKTIAQMMHRFENLLGSIVAHPDTPLSELEIVSQVEREYQAMEDQARQQSKVVSLRAARRSRVDLSHLNLTKTRYLAPEETLPLVIEPASEDIDMLAWTKDNIGFIETALLRHGALLFRGFSVSTPSQFEAFAQAICPELFGDYGDLPREEITEKVYESTPYPSDQMILFHNESSHMNRWPLKQWFFCLRAAQRGGETPIVDCRKVYRLIDPQIVDKFTRAHIMYVRNFTDGLDVSWQNFFKTTDRSVVENWCKNAGIALEWTGADNLRIRQVCPAVATHPKTGEKVWFNQLQHWHLACLDQATRQSMLSIFREKELPRNCYYGDGSIIEDCVMEHVGEIYRNSAVSFPWQQGDILMIDNMLTAHARNTYEGPRKILVAMGEMIGKESCNQKPN